MEPTPFELTPKQKDLLASLLNETGQPASRLIPAIAEALVVLEGHSAPGGTTDSEEHAAALNLPPRKKRLGEIAEELFGDLPEEELARLPVDGAAQHDHYIYGLPKRPA